MKTAVSIPDDLFASADRVAAQLGKSRSEFYADALREHVRQHGDDEITARLDAVYDGHELADEDVAALEAGKRTIRERSPW